MDATENPSEIIERLGGPTRTAELCEVTTQAVCQWRENGIPKARLQFLRLARPDIFKTAQQSPPDTQPQ